MNRFVSINVAIFLATGCIGIVDNSDMADGERDGGANVGTGVTSGTTTTGSSNVSAGSAGSSVATGSPRGSGGSAPASTGSSSVGSGGDPSGGSGSVAPVGAGGASGGSGSIAPVGVGGAFGGSGGFSGGSSGAPPDAGMGGGRAGATGGAAPDAGSDASTAGGATYAQVKAIVQQRCMGCHRGFETYATLTTHAVSRCGNDKLATANDPANSAFLELTQGQGCGGFLMPRGCSSAPCISAAEIQTFTSWIKAGAPNN